jgi:hypothetical protein
MHTHFRDVAALAAGVLLLGSAATGVGLLALVAYLAVQFVSVAFRTFF